ncbi:MAG: type IV pilus secretin PilQ, partial [Gammaproteobacteria bacterium]
MTPNTTSHVRTQAALPFTGASLSRYLIAFVAMLAGATAFAQGSGNRLLNIDAQALPGQQVELRLRTSGPAPEPLSFTIDNPARISLDLRDTALGLSSRRQDIGMGALRTVLAAEANGRTRIVLNLDTLVPYTTRVEGDTIIVLLGSTTASGGSVIAQSNPSQPFAGGTATSGGSIASTGFKAVENVDFRRSSEGAGRVVVTLTDPKTIVDLREEGGRVIVDFKDTALPVGLQRRYDVLDFATPVSTVDARQVAGDARIVISAHEAFEQVAYQSDNLFTVELQEYVPTAEERFEDQQNKVYVGERLTLNFQDIETRAVLQLLADVSKQNIVVSDTVQGNVTLRLQNVPWDQALDIVLQTKGLDMRQNDNVIIVAPAEEIAARERQELEALREFEELAPLRSEFIQVNYAKASNLATLIQGVPAQGAQGGAGGLGGNQQQRSLLSDRGTVTVDERTNTLLINDTTDKLAEIRRLVTRLDIPVRQVLIESRVVVVNDDFRRDLGVRAGYTNVTDNSSDGLITVTGSATGSDVTVGSALDNLQDNGQAFPVLVGDLADRLNVNLPVANPAGRFALAILDSDYLVDLELSAVQAEGRGEIISTPRVIATNQIESRILQGVEIPFQEAAASGATATQFKEAVLELRVTPLITPDDRIIMDLLVSQDNVGENVPSATGGFVPSIDTREVETQVIVNNGETVVLGGIYETENREIDSKVPILGDLPGIGALFRTTSRISNKSELLIFVTPRILNDSA